VAIADEYSDGAEPRPELGGATRRTFDPTRAQLAGSGIARAAGGLRFGGVLRPESEKVRARCSRCG